MLFHEKDICQKSEVLFDRQHFAQFDIRNEGEQENGALHTSQRMKRLVEAILVAVGGELA